MVISERIWTAYCTAPKKTRTKIWYRWKKANTNYNSLFWVVSRPTLDVCIVGVQIGRIDAHDISLLAIGSGEADIGSFMIVTTEGEFTFEVTDSTYPPSRQLWINLFQSLIPPLRKWRHGEISIGNFRKILVPRRARSLHFQCNVWLLKNACLRW